MRIRHHTLFAIRFSLWILIAGTLARPTSAQSFEVRHFAGSVGGPGTRDARGTQARFYDPKGAWGDGVYLYVADGNAVRRVTLATADVTTIAGDIIEAGAIDAVGLSARFDTPAGLWGNSQFLYIVDSRNGRIRRMSLQTNEVTTVAGSARGTRIDGPISQAIFQAPFQITGDGSVFFVSEGYVYDVRGRLIPGVLRKIDLIQSRVTTIPFTPSNVFSDAPAGLWLENDTLYYGYNLSGNGTIAALEVSTNTIRSVLPPLGLPGFGRPNSLWKAGNFLYVGFSSIVARVDLVTGQFETLFGAAESNWIDGAGTAARFAEITGLWGNGQSLYVADRFNYAIRVANAQTGAVKTYAGLGATNTPTSFPGSGIGRIGIWSDGTSIYRAFEWSIRKYNLSTGTETIFAGGVKGMPFRRINGLWGDGTFLFVADGDNNTVYKVRLSTGEVIPASESFSSPFGVWGVGNDLYVTQNRALWKMDRSTNALTDVATFSLPGGLYSDGAFLFVLDGSRLRQLDLATGSVTTPWSYTEPLDGISGDENFLYIATRCQILKFDRTWTPNVVAGKVCGTNDGVSETAQLQETPGGMWRVGSLIYFMDSGRLRTFDISSGAVTTLAERTTFQADGVGDSAHFLSLRGVWGDGTHLYVTDDDAVRTVDLQTLEVKTVAGILGLRGSQDGIGAQAKFSEPIGVCSDGRNVYVADQLNGMIRRITHGSWQVSMITATKGSYPTSLWCDGASIYVGADRSVQRIALPSLEITTIDNESRVGSVLAGDSRFIYVASFNDPTIVRINRQTLEKTIVNAALPTIPLIVNIGAMVVSNDKLYFSYGNAIHELDLTTGKERTIAGETFSRGSEDGIGQQGRFFGPSGLWTDGATLYVIDHANDGHDAIRTISIAPTVTSSAVSLPSFGTSRQITQGSATTARTGYVTIQGNSAASSIAATALFAFHSGDVVISEAAVPASTAIASGRFFVEQAGRVRTGVAIANPNAQAVTISFHLNDATGNRFGDATTILGANSQIAAFLDEAPFYPSGLSRPLADARTLTFSASQPVAVVAIRGYTNQRSEFLMTTLPVLDLANSSQASVIPHFANGGGWSTEIVLTNPSEAAIAGTLTLLDHNGTATDSRRYTIAGSSAQVLQLDSTAALPNVGSIRMTPDAANSAPSGVCIFAYTVNGTRITETGVPTLPAAASLRGFAEMSSDVRTALAITNPNAAAVTVNVDVINRDGTGAGSGTLQIPANGGASLFINEIAGLQSLESGFKGTMKLSTVGGTTISAVMLRGRTNGRNEFLVSTMTPYADASASTFPLYFPHIVDGGGYTTEFIIFNKTGDSSVSTTMLFFTPSGELLPLTLIH